MMEENYDILKKLAGSKNPFSMPDNYFENFSKEMEGKVQAINAPVFSLKKIWKYAAAAIIIAVVATQSYIYNTEKQYKKSAEKYETYVLLQVDEASLIDFYTENQK